MTTPIYTYDEISDTLYISFAPGEKATLAQRTEAGPRSLPLTGLNELSSELQELALDVLQRPPVAHVLSLSTYAPSLTESIPVATLQPLSSTNLYALTTDLTPHDPPV